MSRFRGTYGLLLIGLLLILLTFYLIVLITPTNQQIRSEVIEIAPGSTLPQIAQQLVDQGVIDNPRRFRLAAFLMCRDTRLRAGRFNLKRVTNYYELIRTLADWEIEFKKVTIPEGLTNREIARLLNQKLGISEAHFLALANSAEVARSFGFEAPSLEGYLFPATYQFLEGDSPEFIIQRMVAKFKEVVDDSLRAVIKKRRMTLNQVITLASIVEGECMVYWEQPIVASVYYNRLKRGMRLEACPTVQYIIPDSHRRLKRVDLKIESPYNTYIHYGLPPGPINNPGKRAILATIYPAQTKYLYMVSNGDSTHTFTNSYEEFLEAKKRLQRVRKELALAKKGQ